LLCLSQRQYYYSRVILESEKLVDGVRLVFVYEALRGKKFSRNRAYSKLKKLRCRQRPFPPPPAFRAALSAAHPAHALQTTEARHRYPDTLGGVFAGFHDDQRRSSDW